ncbi:hypothetical protein OAF54_01640, partial [bacterium]|nr:hypothetical protein [bacterium]
MEISLETLVEYFEDSADSTVSAREKSEQCRDYYDGIQLTEAEVSELTRRKQPPVVFNRIQPKVDFLLGTERKMRTDPKAFPRTPTHDHAADAVTDGIRYVCDNNNFDVLSSDVFENELIEGMGGVSVEVDPETLEIKLKRFAWDRYFYDPHSRERNHSDSRYDGIVLWMDFEEAKERWPKSADGLGAMMTQATGLGETYDDKPNKWFDSKRKRVMIVQINFIHMGVWNTAIYTKGSMLEAPKPIAYLDEFGKPENNFIAVSAKVTRGGDRYG